jgi:hypothetical protein
MSIRFPALLAIVCLALTTRPVDTFAQEVVLDPTDDVVYIDGDGSDLDIGFSGNCDGDCGGCNCCRGGGLDFNVRVGGMYQQRGTFRLGTITEDSNDVDAGQHVIYAEPGFDVGGDGVNFELMAGMDLNSCWRVEGRFGYASLNEDGNFALDDLDDISFQAGSGGFWVPFIDASTPEHGRGIFGMRLRNNINVDYEYDSNWFDFGADFVYQLATNDCHRVELVVGPSFSNIDQKFRHVTTGDWNGDEQTSDVRQDLNEWFYGAKFALRGERSVTPRLSLVGGLTAHAYYHHADFNGTQYVDTAGALGDTYNVNVSDDASNFAARLGLDAGLNFQVNPCMTVGFLYRLESWHNVSSVENPDLTLYYADGDNRWAGDNASHLTDDQSVTNTFMATVEWRR